MTESNLSFESINENTVKAISENSKKEKVEIFMRVVSDAEIKIIESIKLEMKQLTAS